MWYHNKRGDAFWIGNAISFFHSVEHPEIEISINIITGNLIRSFNIETIHNEDIEGLAKEFIEWIVMYLRMQQETLSWKDYLEYREKVLPAMKADSPNWEDHEKEKNEKQLLLFGHT